MIYTADKNDIQALSALWSSVFGDTDSYIDFFMKNRFPSCTTLLKKECGELGSALYMLDGKLDIEGRLFDSRYIYAAATLPQFRGRGFMAELIETSKRVASEQGADFITLVPAEKSLFGYYERFGFDSVFSSNRIELSDIDAFEPDTEQYITALDRLPDFDEAVRLRSRVYGKNYFVWDSSALKYAFEECLFNGGRTALMYKNEALCGYALYFTENGETEISELCAPRCETKALVCEIARNADRVAFELPSIFEFPGEKYDIIDKGMALALNESASDALKKVKNSGGAFFSLALE